MKYALQHINALFGYYQYYYKSSIVDMADYVGKELKMYLNENYKKMDGTDYFCIIFNEEDQLYKFKINDSFEADFIKHYPEKMI